MNADWGVSNTEADSAAAWGFSNVLTVFSMEFAKDARHRIVSYELVLSTHLASLNRVSVCTKDWRHPKLESGTSMTSASVYTTERSIVVHPCRWALIPCTSYQTHHLQFTKKRPISACASRRLQTCLPPWGSAWQVIGNHQTPKESPKRSFAIQNDLSLFQNIQRAIIFLFTHG